MSNHNRPDETEKETDEIESWHTDEIGEQDLAIRRRDALKLLGAGAVAGSTLGSLPEPARASLGSPITRLTASDGGSFDSFGSTMALHGLTAIIGAPDADTDDGEDAGKVYAFKRISGDWVESQILKPHDPHAFHEFGSAIALSGEALVIGAIESNDANPGGVYVFRRDDGPWREEQKLTASDGHTDDAFGISAALSADGATALAGALGAVVDGEKTGAAYVFTQDGETWTEEAKLSASDASSGDAFANFEAVALDRTGETALVGDALQQNESGDAVGAAYVFRREGGAWPQTAKLTAGDHADVGDQFGTCVALSDDGRTAVVGAPRDDGDPNNQGAVYVFTFDDSEWSLDARLLAEDGQRHYFFGFPVAVTRRGDAILTGAMGNESAFLFTQEDDTWTQANKLLASEGQSDAEFGSNVAAQGSRGLVGADSEDTARGESAGAAYLFEDLTDPVVNLELSDVRPIQTVENTVLRNPSGDDEVVSPEIPEFIAGRNMSVLFSLEESQNFALLPPRTNARVTVTRDYGTSIETDSFRLDSEALGNLVSDSVSEAKALDLIDDDDAPPVFETTSNLNDIRIAITPTDSTEPEFSGDTEEIDFNRNFNVTEMDELDVGFIEIADPTGGDNYGNSSGRIKDDFDTLVDKVVEHYEATFPVDIVRAFKQLKPPLDDSDVIQTEAGSVSNDLKSAHRAIEDTFPAVDFDVTVAFVPEGFPSFHSDGFNGIHYSGVEAAAAVRGDLRVDKRVEELHTTSAQEVGHHFLGDVYPDKLSMRQKGGDIDNSHARTEPDGANNTPDKKYIDSTGVDLADGSFNLVGTRLESFMSYNFDEYPMWADTHEYQAMIDSGLDGHPSSDDDSGRTPEPLIEGIGRLVADDTTTFTRVFKTEGIPKSSVPGGAVTVTVLDAVDETIDSRTYSDHLEADLRTENTERSHIIEEDIFAFAVPFPEEAAAIEAERNGTVTRLNPVERSLRGAIARLPDAAFSRGGRGRRKALNNKLDELDEKMAAGEYRDALNKLENDIRDKLEKWLRDEYETSALQPTKAELLALVDEMITRLETLVGTSSS